MAKKLVKSVFGGKKKKAAPAEDGKPVVTPLGPDGKTVLRRAAGRRAQTAAQVETILSEKLGDGKSWKLGG